MTAPPRHATLKGGRAERVRTLTSAVLGAYRTTRAAARSLTRAVVVLQLLSIVSLVGQLLLVRALLVKLTDQSPRFVDLVPYGVGLVLAYLVSTLAVQAVASCQRLLSERVTAHSTGVVLESATAVELIEFEDADVHDRIQRALMNAGTRPAQITSALVTVISSLGTAVAVGATVLVLAPELFAIALLAVGPVAYMTVGSSRVMYDFSIRQTAADRRRVYLQLLLVHRDSAKEVRAYRLGGRLVGQWRASYDARLTDLSSVVRRRFVKVTIGALGASIGLAAAVLTLFWLLTSGRLSVASAAAVAAALLLLSRQLQGLAAGVGTLYEAALFIEDYQGFIEQTARSRDERSSLRKVTGPSLRSVALDHVTFTYPAAAKSALTDVSVRIDRGEVVALVGVNGSGKSTAAKLIAGLYAPQGGQVTWNGRSYVELSPDAIRGQVGVLFQDYIRFQMSVRENIALGRPERREVADEDVAAAARAAGADDVIAGLTDGLDTELGPEFVGGTELSGGQWQRLALARAAFRDAPLVILDEPTAALDPLAEERLFNNTRRIFEGKSVLLISHRFSSVRLADRIYVLDAGQVVEVGTHDELMAQDAHYARMYRAQHQALLGPMTDDDASAFADRGPSTT